MFKKSATTLQRPKFSLKHDHIIEDLEAVSNTLEERNKLFSCLDDKYPQDGRYNEMEGFLKGTQKLEEISKTLQLQVVKLQILAEGLTTSIDEIEGKIEACQ